MLSKYAGLTGRDYLAFFDEYRREYTRSFPLLVRAGIIDLWDFFEKHRDDEATRSRYNSLEYVWSYASADGGMTMFRPKGYYTSNGYVGFLPDGSRMSFPTQDEYEEYVREWDVTEAA